MNKNRFTIIHSIHLTNIILSVTNFILQIKYDYYTPKIRLLVMVKL